MWSTLAFQQAIENICDPRFWNVGYMIDASTGLNSVSANHITIKDDIVLPVVGGQKLSYKTKKPYVAGDHTILAEYSATNALTNRIYGYMPDTQITLKANTTHVRISIHIYGVTLPKDIYLAANLGLQFKLIP